MVRAAVPAKALGKSECPKLFEDISPEALDAAPAGVVLETAKKLLRTGRKLKKLREDEQYYRRRALRVHGSEWLPPGARIKWERNSLRSIMLEPSASMDENTSSK